MRQLIVSMNVTLDGFMAGPNCELDWHFRSWTSEMAEILCEELHKADTLLLGRLTYTAMARYWPTKMLDHQFPREDLALAEMMHRYQKIVYSRTLATADWHNSKLLKSNLVREVTSLKKQNGKNIMVYGSGRLVAALMQAGLIDMYQLWLHPVALGQGRLLFTRKKSRLHLQVRQTRTFSSGVVLCYCGVNA
jgi:dihydrofolate reductase